MKLKILSALVIALLLTAAAGYSKNTKVKPYGFVVSFAEDDEKDEDEKEDEEDDDDDEEEDDEEDEVVYEKSNPSPNVTTLSPQVVRLITIVDPGFGKDSDKDGLVDAIDPNPTVNQKLYFTDSDNDGVPDATDTHPGDDDFKFIEFTDTNSNGILDSLEGV